MNDFGAASLEELQTLLEPGTKFSPQDLVRIVEAKARSDEAIAIMMNGMLVEHKLDFIRMKSRNNSGIK